MLDFDLVIPTKIFFGKGKEEKIGDIIKNFGYSKVLIVIGRNSVIKSGLLDKVVNKLNQNGISFKILSSLSVSSLLGRPDCLITTSLLGDIHGGMETSSSSLPRSNLSPVLVSTTA